MGGRLPQLCKEHQGGTGAPQAHTCPTDCFFNCSTGRLAGRQVAFIRQASQVSVLLHTGASRSAAQPPSSTSGQPCGTFLERATGGKPGPAISLTKCTQRASVSRGKVSQASVPGRLPSAPLLVLSSPVSSAAAQQNSPLRTSRYFKSGCFFLIPPQNVLVKITNCSVMCFIQIFSAPQRCCCMFLFHILIPRSRV